MELKKRSINNGRYVMSDAKTCITNSDNGRTNTMPMDDAIVRLLAQFSLIFFNL